MKDIICKICNTQIYLKRWLLKIKKSPEQKIQQKHLLTFLTNLGSNLVKKVPNFSNPYTSFLNQTHDIMKKNTLSITELKKAFF